MSVGDDSQNPGARICSDQDNCGGGIVGARDDNKNCEDEICRDPENEMVGTNVGDDSQNLGTEIFSDPANYGDRIVGARDGDPANCGYEIERARYDSHNCEVVDNQNPEAETCDCGGHEQKYEAELWG